MKIVIVATLFCLSTLNAQTASLKVIDVQRDRLSSTLPQRITISCTADYDSTRCVTSAGVLAKVLERYPTARLGDWNFVVASSEHWQQVVNSLGRDPGSPAFSELAARVTVLEDTLFENGDSRKLVLARRYGQSVGDLLDFAVTHELGHAICHERNERLADEYGRALRRGQLPVCENGL